MARPAGRRPAHLAPSSSRRWIIVLGLGVTIVALVVVALVSRSDSPSRETVVDGPDEDGPPVGERPLPDDGSLVVVAVGDIVCSPDSGNFNDGEGTATLCRSKATYELAASLDPDVVLPLGDVQYECGTEEEFAAFDATWGAFGPRLRPAIGNHEYGHACGRDDATPYFDYFGARAGEPGHGWYSFDVGGWHLIALNSECSYGEGAVGGCNTGSEQEQWLRADLAASDAACTIAYWHEPRFSSGQHGNNESMTDMWNLLVDARVDIALAGHNHVYERFEPLGPTERVPGRPALTEEGDAIDIQDPVTDPLGIRNFVVGTGGKNLYTFTHRPLTGEVVRNDDTYGVLKLTLQARSYDWEFVPLEGGGGFTDRGSANCV